MVKLGGNLGSDKQQAVRMLEPLTSFRFIAALLVFTWHTHVLGRYLDQYQLGYAGVGFFYLLSGFILTYVYFDKLAHRSKKASRSFYIARIAKIYPVHLLTFVLSLPLALATYGVLSGQLHLQTIWMAITNLTLTQTYVPNTMFSFSFNGVSWSISVELFFYALFPFIIALMYAYRRLLTPRKIAIGVAAYWLVAVLFLWSRQSHVDDWVYYILPLSRLPEFITGICMGLIFMRLLESKHVLLTISARVATWLEVGALGLVTAAVLVSPFVPQAVRFGTWLMPFWAVLIFVFALQRGHISALMSKRPLIFLGEISFSFYMLHALTLNYIKLASLPLWATAAVGLVATTALSAACYLYFEEPMRLRVKASFEAWARSLLRMLRLKKAQAPAMLAESEPE